MTTPVIKVTIKIHRTDGTTEVVTFKDLWKAMDDEVVELPLVLDSLAVEGE